MPLSLAICLHNHQPVGNLEEAFQGAYERAYAPFLTALEAHPFLEVVLHYTGPLLDWLGERHPDFLDRLGALVERGQVELLGGGYYEPILALLPERDALGQIALMKEALERRFGVTPRGLWLAERVWQPELAPLLDRAGVEYTILDDNNFQATGLTEEQSLGYFTLPGSRLRVFPINQTIRRGIPFSPAEQAIEHLLALGNTGGLALFADDGEKLGDWPSTYQTVYEERYLERLCDGLTAHADQIQLVLLSEYLDSHPSLGEVAVPAGSYAEMMEWSGGSWLNFLARYPEAKLMAGKMKRVSELVAAMPADPAKDAARRSLYQGQCNCPYWHGVFGGLYLPHLRAANYHALLAAETFADPSFIAHVRRQDLDEDGRKKAVLSSGSLQACFDPDRGGALFELDDWRIGWNLLSTLARRREPYHPDGLHYDWYLRQSLLDHFLAPDVTLESFANCAYGEQGDFVDQPYEAAVSPEDVEITLSREGHVWVGPDWLPVRVEKRIGLGANSSELLVEYMIVNQSDRPAELVFAPEFNFTLSGFDSERYFDLPKRPPLDWQGSLPNRDSLRLVDDWLGLAVSLQLSPPAEVWVFPVRTVSRTTISVETIYQSTVVLPRWRLKLAAAETWRANLHLSLEAGERK